MAFYVFLNERSLVSAQTVTWVPESIKEERPDWLATMRRYDAPSITDPADTGVSQSPGDRQGFRRDVGCIAKGILSTALAYVFVPMIVRPL